MDPSSPELDALVVLGCKVHEGAPSAALERRLVRARQSQCAAPLVVMSGGKTWAGASEAEVMAAWWQTSESRLAGDSTPAVELLLENGSLTTRENAFYTARLLRPRTVRRIGLVTCDYHMWRAGWLFRSQGFVVVPLAARVERPWAARTRLALKESIACCLSAFERPR